MQIVFNFFRKLFSRKPKLTVVPPLKVDAPDDAPLWYRIAFKEIGIKEFIKGDNPRIIEYHSATKLKATKDEIFWCSSFVCWCLETAGIRSPESAWARSFLKWGVPLIKPQLGCIVVLSRGSDSGHVGLWHGETATTIFLLAGNQSDAVNISEHSKSKLLGYRWPS